MNELPPMSEEEGHFFRRVGQKMVPLVRAGADLPEAQQQAAQLVAEDMLAEGADRQSVARHLEKAIHLASTNSRPEDIIDLSESLHEALLAALRTRGIAPFALLSEKVVTTPTGYRMFVFPNESKHQGRPHVKVELPKGPINVSISASPTVLAGKGNQKGVAAVLSAVKENCEALLEEWDASRPDDQKLANSKRQVTARAKTAKIND